MSLVITDPSRRWPNAIVPYAIDDDHFPSGSPERQVIEDAIQRWNNETGMTLVPVAGQTDFVMFREQEAGCNSSVGRVGGEQRILCDLGGSSQAVIPDQWSKAAPALGVYGGNLHMVHLGSSSNDLWHSWFDGTQWSDNIQVRNASDNSVQTSKAPVALAAFDGLLHMIHLGDSSNDLWHTWFDGTQWSDNIRVRNASDESVQKSKAPVALAAFDGLLHMVHIGDSSNDLWHTWFDGTQWSDNVQVRNAGDDSVQTSKAAPALAVLGDELHMVHLGNTSNDIWHTRFGGGVWTTNVRVEDPDGNVQRSQAAPALAHMDGELHLVHIGNTSKQLWHSAFDGTAWGHSTQIVGQKSKATPAVAAYDGRLHIVHLGASSKKLWHSKLDEGASSFGVNGIMHEIGHAIGLSHEQQREDRGHFVVIDLDEVIEEKQPNFEQVIAGSDDSGLYDYDSIMHYGPRSFADNNGVTIARGHASASYLGDYANIGAYSGFSAGDLDAIYALYPAWSENIAQRDLRSRVAPALASYRGRLHMVFLGEFSNQLWHTTFDGDDWSPAIEIERHTSKAAPALAVFDDLLHLVHLGESSNDLWHSTYNGFKWADNEQIEDQKSKTTPALATFRDRLHMVHLGDSSNDIWHSSYDGEWTPNARAVPNQTSKAAPALAVWRDGLHMVHLGNSSNDLWYSVFDGGRWSPNVPVYHQQSKAAVALVEFGSALHMLHLGDTSNTIWHSINDEVWRPNIPIDDQLSKATPAAAVFQNQIHMMHTGDTSNVLWHTTHSR